MRGQLIGRAAIVIAHRLVTQSVGLVRAAFTAERANLLHTLHSSPFRATQKTRDLAGLILAPPHSTAVPLVRPVTTPREKPTAKLGRETVALPRIETDSEDQKAVGAVEGY